MRLSCHSAVPLLLAICSTVVTGAGPTYTDWGTPVRLASIEAPGYLTISPFLSKDGSRLYFGSDRPGGAGGLDIWVAGWNDFTEQWNLPVNLGEVVNGSDTDAYPALSRDEHWLFFMSTREGGFGGHDLWVSYREHVGDDFGWQAPVNLGPAINSPGEEASPSFFANDEAGVPQLFFTSTRNEASADLDVYVADMIGPLVFLPATPVAELNTARNLPGSKGLEISVSVRHDGLEVYLTSNRLGSINAGQDIWRSSRGSVWSSWLPPVNAGPLINTTGVERDAMISADRQRLFFTRADGIYQSIREKGRQP